MRARRPFVSAIVAVGMTAAWAGACSSPPERTFVDEGGDIDGGSSGGRSGSGGGGSSTGGRGGGKAGAGGGGSGCAGEGEECESPSDCCETSTGSCIEFEDGAGSTLACGSYCTKNSECDSDCCAPQFNDESRGACAPNESFCGGPGCRDAGYSCDSDADCCGPTPNTPGSRCIELGVGPRVCAAICETGADCQSGCCVTTSVGGVCLPSELCCSNACASPGDGECDDGGEDSVTAVCAFGTDCEDCGSRDALCDNNCEFSNDGECDDGGIFANTDACEYGTDCGDCGLRDPNPPTGNECTDTCLGANDGMCQDPTGSEAIGCRLGTDCTDCEGGGAAR